MEYVLTLLAQASAADDVAQVRQCHLERVVDDQVVEFAEVGHLGDGIVHAPGDDLRGVLGASGKPLGQSLPGGRQDEDADAAGVALANLARSLPIDLENWSFN